METQTDVGGFAVRARISIYRLILTLESPNVHIQLTQDSILSNDKDFNM